MKIGMIEAEVEVHFKRRDKTVMFYSRVPVGTKIEMVYVPGLKKDLPLSVPVILLRGDTFTINYEVA